MSTWSTYRWSSAAGGAAGGTRARPRAERLATDQRARGRHDSAPRGTHRGAGVRWGASLKDPACGAPLCVARQLAELLHHALPRLAEPGRLGQGGPAVLRLARRPYAVPELAGRRGGSYDPALKRHRTVCFREARRDLMAAGESPKVTLSSPSQYSGLRLRCGMRIRELPEEHELLRRWCGGWTRSTGASGWRAWRTRSFSNYEGQAGGSHSGAAAGPGRAAELVRAVWLQR